MSDKTITKLYDAQGQLLGVLLSPEAWQAVQPILEPAGNDVAAIKEPKELLGDWETLKSCWDFPYPVDTDVACEACGASTEDFQADDPRKFLLTAASLSGLVSFYCRNCRAKIIKRHFKDVIRSETKPYQEEKDSRNEARYSISR